MNICIVCAKLNHGGAERVAVSLANGFCDRGHHVVLMSSLKDVVYLVDSRVKLIELFGGKTGKMERWLTAVKCIRKTSKEEKVDIIIGIMKLCSLLSKIATTFSHIPVIMTEHSSFERPLSAPFSRAEFFSKFYLNKLYNHVTVLTKADQIVAQKKLKHVTVMPNPLSISPQNNQKETRRKVILAAGRLEDWHYKGFDVLINAWGKIANEYPEWILEIAGAGTDEEKRKIYAFAESAKIRDRIRLLGFRNNVVELYQSSEIFVLSSRYEGFGLVLVEAMSQGCACIACDYKGRQKEIFGVDNCGVLCEPDNVNALSHAIRTVVEDEQYRKELQMRAIERSKFYSIGHVISIWESFLENIVNQK